MLAGANRAGAAAEGEKAQKRSELELHTHSDLLVVSAQARALSGLGFWFVGRSSVILRSSELSAALMLKCLNPERWNLSDSH